MIVLGLLMDYLKVVGMVVCWGGRLADKMEVTSGTMSDAHLAETRAALLVAELAGMRVAMLVVMMVASLVDQRGG